MDADMLAIVQGSHPLLHDLTNENLTAYIPLVYPHLRLKEIKREDSIIQDPFVATLAQDGNAGYALGHFLSNEHIDSKNYNILCGYLVERVLIDKQPQITQIVELGATMTMYPYWMENLKDCKIFQFIPSPVVVDFVEQTMNESDAKHAVKEHHMTAADLSEDTWEDMLLSQGFDPSQPTLWIVCNLIAFRYEKDGNRLLELIDELSSPYSQIYADVCQAHKIDFTFGDKNVTFYPGMKELHGNQGTIFRPLAEWKVELVLRRDTNMEYFGTMWDEDAERLQHLRVTDENQETIGPYYMVRFTKFQ